MARAAKYRIAGSNIWLFFSILVVYISNRSKKIRLDQSNTGKHYHHKIVFDHLVVVSFYDVIQKIADFQYESNEPPLLDPTLPASPPQTTKWLYNSLNGRCHEIFALGFSHESSSIGLLIILVTPYRICSKIREDIRQLR